MTAEFDIEESQRQIAFKRDLKAAGFRTRVINALVHSSQLRSINELCSRPWGDRTDTTSLHWELSVCTNLGPKGMAEIVAFREGRDPASAKAPGPAKLTLSIDPDQLAAVDEWIERKGGELSRREAIRSLVAIGIKHEPEPPAEFPNQVGEMKRR